MENIPVTTYRGFSAVSGETTFTQDMADIKNGKHAKLIIKIASLVAQGKVEEANHVKKQLPFRTLTANYRERRLAGKKARTEHHPLQPRHHARHRRPGRRTVGADPDPHQRRPAHPGQFPLPQKARLQAVRLHADGIHPASV